MSEKPSLAETLGATWQLRNLIQSTRADLVQCFLYRANILSPIAARLAQPRPIVVSSQRSLAPLEGGLAVFLSRRTHRLADRIVAVSEAVKSHLIEAEAIGPSRIVVIPNGVNPALYENLDPAMSRQSFELPPDEMIVGAAGRLTPVKDFGNLIRAIARVHAAGIPMRLVLAGEGPLRSNLEALAKELDLGDSVVFPGNIGDMRRFYGALDVFVLSSVREGSPNVVLEAMASGCPVIATNVGGVPELIGDQDSGLLVTPNDPGQLSSALLRLAKDPDLRSELGTNGRRRVSERFDLGASVGAYENLYHKLINQTGR
jgi:glycosyltransferase involved in cell wall biosynthesis